MGTGIGSAPGEGQGEEHSHGPSATADRRYLALALVLIVGFMAVEVVVAVVSGSLALLSDAGHMLSDAGAIAAALYAARLAARPASERWTYGLRRAEILSAAGNGVTLLVVGALVGVEAVRRLVHPPEVAGVPLLVTAAAGVVVNIVATLVLARADRSSLNVRGAFQHILTDLYGFIGTLVAGIVIVTTGYLRADPLASLLVVALMLRAAWGLLRDSGRILLEGTPDDVDLAEVRGHLLSVDHVHDVHDLHLWTVTSNLPSVSAHLVVDESCFADGHLPQLLDRVQECLAGHFDVEHSTFQMEPASHVGHEIGSH